MRISLQLIILADRFFPVGCVVEMLGYSGKCGWVYVIAQSVKFLETHDQRLPFVGVDLIRISVLYDRVIKVNFFNPQFKCYYFTALIGVALG